MNVTEISLDGVLLTEPKVYSEERGCFLESYEKKRYESIGIKEEFVQDNHSLLAKNVLRGLHFTKNNPQAQILTVMRGNIFDAVVDIRKDSSTFGPWFGAK